MPQNQRFYEKHNPKFLVDTKPQWYIVLFNTFADIQLSLCINLCLKPTREQ
uniref:Uncharacterized protein n=1 Tax=Physcomitrium patens TaxID=3218 RepID=A0A2K1K2D3_PHYPA|nr:hypothetical protein PHYPA_012408 [Physcomitrium patens]